MIFGLPSIVGTRTRITTDSISQPHHHTPIWSIRQQMPERKLLDQVSDVARLRHLSLRTEETRPQLAIIITKLQGLRPASPFDAINIDHQRLILHGTSLPDSRAGPAVINGPLNKSRAHLVSFVRFETCSFRIWGVAPKLTQLLSEGRRPSAHRAA